MTHPSLKGRRQEAGGGADQTPQLDRERGQIVSVSRESPRKIQQPRKQRGVSTRQGSWQETSRFGSASARWSSVLSRVTELGPDPSSPSRREAPPVGCRSPQPGGRGQASSPHPFAELSCRSAKARATHHHFPDAPQAAASGRRCAVGVYVHKRGIANQHHRGHLTYLGSDSWLLGFFTTCAVSKSAGWSKL